MVTLVEGVDANDDPLRKEERTARSSAVLSRTVRRAGT